MARAQVTLETHLHKRARQRAAELGISLAEYLRRLVSRDLGEAQQASDPSAIFSLGTSTGSDVAHAKDRMLGEAVDARHSR